MMLALFLHPMSPEHFLALALSRPWETVADRYGMHAAILFWLGFIMLAGGACAWLYLLAAMRRDSPAAASDSTYRISNEEEAEQSWSFM